MKTKLLHDFAVEDDLLLLQGFTILCMVILDHPTQWDFGYWLHNAIRLATKLDLRTAYVLVSQLRQRTTHIVLTWSIVTDAFGRISHAKY